MTDQPIRLLLFTNATARGGAEEHMLTLLHGLDRRQFVCHLVCPPEIAAKLRPDLPADVELLPLCLNNLLHVGSAYRFGKILRDRSIQIVHSHRFYSSLFAAPIAALSRVPVFIETPHLSERWRNGLFTSHFVIDRAIGKFVDRYIAVSEANARYLVEEKGLPRKKVVVIRNGCDLKRFDPAHRVPVEFRAELGFGEMDPVMVVTARLEAQKGHEILFRALPEVLHEFPNARLVCVGDGSLRLQLEALAVDLDIRNSVRFVGHRSNVADWLALADFTILPSLWEGLPLTAIESLAARRAVVATAVDGTPEIVVNGKTGLTVPANDPEKLSSAISCLLRYPELRKKMGEAGRELVSEHFTQERQIQQTEEIYLRTLAEQSMGQPENYATEVEATGPAR